jgi:hypothetical protein
VHLTTGQFGVSDADRREDLAVLLVISEPVVVDLEYRPLFGGIEFDQRVYDLTQDGVPGAGGNCPMELHVRTVKGIVILTVEATLSPIQVPAKFCDLDPVHIFGSKTSQMRLYEEPRLQKV